MAAGLQCWDASGNVIFDSENSRVMHFVQRLNLPASGWYRASPNQVIWHQNVAGLDPNKHITTAPYLMVKTGRMQYYNAYAPTSWAPGNQTAPLFRFA